MKLKRSLVQWMRQFLPDTTRCAQDGAATLLRALLRHFTTDLTQLARQAGGNTTTKSRRQRFDRWLARPHWDPEMLYAGCTRALRRLLRRRGLLPLLVDITELGDEWAVLQVAIPWEKRALPIYRVVVHVKDPETPRRELLREMLAFLRTHLSGSPSEYVLVTDRGFPGHWLVRQLQREGWHFVLRVTRRWKVKHAEYTGRLWDAPQVAGLVGPCPRRLAQAFVRAAGEGSGRVECGGSGAVSRSRL